MNRPPATYQTSAKPSQVLTLISLTDLQKSVEILVCSTRGLKISVRFAKFCQANFPQWIMLSSKLASDETPKWPYECTQSTLSAFCGSWSWNNCWAPSSCLKLVEMAISIIMCVFWRVGINSLGCKIHSEGCWAELTRMVTSKARDLALSYIKRQLQTIFP